jgi:hypothetical protein
MINTLSGELTSVLSWTLVKVMVPATLTLTFSELKFLRYRPQNLWIRDSASELNIVRMIYMCDIGGYGTATVIQTKNRMGCDDCACSRQQRSQVIEFDCGLRFASCPQAVSTQDGRYAGIQ